MTTYRVLRQIEAEGPLPTLVLLGDHEAHDGDGAIVAAIKAMSEGERVQGATYVAVTARSWTEATPEVQLELKVKVR